MMIDDQQQADLAHNSHLADTQAYLNYLTTPDRWKILNPPNQASSPLDHDHAIPNLVWLLIGTTDWDLSPLSPLFIRYLNNLWAIQVQDQTPLVINAVMNAGGRIELLEDPTYPMDISTSQMTFETNWDRYDKDRALVPLAAMWTKVADMIDMVSEHLHHSQDLSPADQQAATLHSQVARMYHKALHTGHSFNSLPG